MLVAAGLVLLILALTRTIERRVLLERKEELPVPAAAKLGGWRLIANRRYLLLIAATLLLAQVLSPLIEYQFLQIIEATYPERETRTAALSLFFSILSGVSIGVNLILTPLILHGVGVLAGLLVQPLAMAIATAGFMAYPSLIPAAMMKISDRGLSYSINRAAKELLYIPVEPSLMAQAKAWIDMFGYRMFKALGSLIVIGATALGAHGVGVVDLGWLVIGGCVLWSWVLILLHREYRHLTTPSPARNCPAYPRTPKT